MKRFKFWQDGFSIDEGRVSAVIIGLLSTLSVALWAYITRGDMTGNMLALLTSFLAAVSGMNIASMFSKKAQPPVENTDYTENGDKGVDPSEPKI